MSTAKRYIDMYNKTMPALIFLRYTVWHYTQAPALLYQVLLNLLWFLGHLFSIGMLSRTLFSPWKRVIAERRKRWDLEDIASAIVANTFSRIIGAFIRLVLIVVGLCVQLSFLLFSIVFYVLWFVLPFLLVGIAVFGVYLIIFNL